MSFKKVKEDFNCENCGYNVLGNGYTNHCPNCVFSKHVDDRFPGDRASSCESLMEPISVVIAGGLPEKVMFKCQKCSKKIYNKISQDDNIDIISKLPIEK